MVTLGQAASVASAGASVAVGVPVGAGVGAGTSTRWPTVRKHWVPRLLISMIERTETSKKKAMLRQLSPSLTVYSTGGSGVGEGTLVKVGVTLGTREGVAVRGGVPLGAAAATPPPITRLAAKVRPGETSASPAPPPPGRAARGGPPEPSASPATRPSARRRSRVTCRGARPLRPPPARM